MTWNFQCSVQSFWGSLLQCRAFKICDLLQAELLRERCLHSIMINLLAMECISSIRWFEVSQVFMMSFEVSFHRHLQPWLQSLQRKNISFPIKSAELKMFKSMLFAWVWTWQLVVNTVGIYLTRQFLCDQKHAFWRCSFTCSSYLINEDVANICIKINSLSLCLSISLPLLFLSSHNSWLITAAVDTIISFFPLQNCELISGNAFLPKLWQDSLVCVLYLDV